ncbi:sulfite exporter TauE/SafE family protein [Peribacillus frigoritolerans]|uniref:sulfite exporter TauE/SafE family protein n=1 Tax=Peribacillus frigoritolerans TaxID=450367 RepID=UPI0020797DCD|nr:sulfite exporter TauE/SafE family protein [Peribacillus frigoritolerans]
MTISSIILVVAAVFIGALMRTMFGFGEAIVSMPLLALLHIPLNTSVSLIGLAGLTVASLTVVSGWRHIERPVLIRLAASTVIGIPAGLALLHYAPSMIITSALGVFLIAYGGYSLLKQYFFRLWINHYLTRRAGYGRSALRREPLAAPITLMGCRSSSMELCEDGIQIDSAEHCKPISWYPESWSLQVMR